MVKREIPLQPGKTYQIFNHANGKENLFQSRDNYLYFLKKFGEKVAPVLDVFAYCLMPNHVHFAARVKPAQDIVTFWKYSKEVEMSDETDVPMLLSKMWGTFFQSYTQAFNATIPNRFFIYPKF